MHTILLPLWNIVLEMKSIHACAEGGEKNPIAKTLGLSYHSLHSKTTQAVLFLIM